MEELSLLTKQNHKKLYFPDLVPSSVASNAFLTFPKTSRHSATYADSHLARYSVETEPVSHSVNSLLARCLSAF